MPWSSFFECWVSSQLFPLSSFTFIKRLFSFLFAFCHKDGVVCISEIIDISPSNLDSSLCFIHPSILHDAYELNKQGDNIQPWCIPFPIWNQSVVPCLSLTVASWPAYRFLIQEAGKVAWYSDLFKNFPQCVVIHTVKGFGIVNKAEVDVFLELSCFFDDPTDVGNLISGSSVFSKSSLNIWKFSVHILLKPCLENFEHYFASMWDECNCAVVWTFFGVPFLWDCNENWPFQSCGHCWVFQICWSELNQIPYDYAVGVTSRFKGLDLIECLKNYGWRFMTLYSGQWPRPSPRKWNSKRQNGCLRRPCK